MKKNSNGRYIVANISGLRNSPVKTNFSEETNDVNFYSLSWHRFFSDNDSQYEDKYINSLAILINSPWSHVNQLFIIVPDTDENQQTILGWQCTYQVIGYDGISTTIYGYGKSEEEAMKNCKDFFKYLQANYNKEGISI